MALRILFADSFYWIALIYPRDSYHAQVLSVSRSLAAAKLLTTDEVLSEVLTHFAGLGAYWRKKVASIVHDARRDPAVDVLPQTRADFDAALAFYESRPDKNYSLTDCRSMAAMKSLALQDVLSNDHHFAQEGFTVLFP